MNIDFYNNVKAFVDKFCFDSRDGYNALTLLYLFRILDFRNFRHILSNIS